VKIALFISNFTPKYRVFSVLSKKYSFLTLFAEKYKKTKNRDGKSG
jgi:hypothetical protein